MAEINKHFDTTRYPTTKPVVQECMYVTTTTFGRRASTPPPQCSQRGLSSGRFQPPSSRRLFGSVRQTYTYRLIDPSRCFPPPHRAHPHPHRQLERDVFGIIDITIVYPVPSSSARLRRRRTKRWTLTRVSSSSNAKTTYSSIAEAFESTTGRTLPSRPVAR